jgi:glycosyltransferase involved in cell wall biosynthesis
LTQRAGKVLREKHGEGIIQSSVEYMNPNRILEGIRASSGTFIEREKYISSGRNTFAGKKVLFILPVMDAGGGANVVIDEARAMRSMGVEVQIFNLAEYKSSFLSSYPHLDLPAVFGKVDHLPNLANRYDAIVATANYSVEWLKPLEGQTKLGYYIQGFEPLMYPRESKEAKRAAESYSLINGLKRFTKTEWVRRTVLEHTKMDSDVIGISVNIDLFRPRDVRPMGKKPVTIVAMIRPESPYRSPELTVAVLRRIQKEYGRMVNIIFFGTDSLDEHRALFQLDFEWKLAGKLTQLQVANLLSKSEIFVDFSTHQAMGLTSLEAMACGCSVIVPQEGGAVEFVKDRENGLVVPVISQEACYQQLRILVEDDYLRQRLQLAGLRSVSKFFPEKAGYNLLKSLFS